MQITTLRTSPPVQTRTSSATFVQEEAPAATFEKNLFQKAGDRLQYAAGTAALGAGMAAASFALPMLATTALSFLIPPWVPLGGMMGNLLIGGGLGAAVAMGLDNKFNAPPRTEDERIDRKNFVLAGACFGAMGGFMGIAGCPGATVDWPGVAVFSGGMMGTAAAVLGVSGFAGSLVKGPGA